MLIRSEGKAWSWVSISLFGRQSRGRTRRWTNARGAAHFATSVMAKNEPVLDIFLFPRGKSRYSTGEDPLRDLILYCSRASSSSNRRCRDRPTRLDPVGRSPKDSESTDPIPSHYLVIVPFFFFFLSAGKKQNHLWSGKNSKGSARGARWIGSQPYIFRVSRGSTIHIYDAKLKTPVVVHFEIFFFSTLCKTSHSISSCKPFHSTTRQTFYSTDSQSSELTVNCKCSELTVNESLPCPELSSLLTTGGFH